MTEQSVIYPPSLMPGDTIAIVSPATTVKEEYVFGAERRLQEMGYKVRIMPGALGPSDGSYASSAERRLQDLQDAVSDTDIKAILCARGGYGAVHLIEQFDAETLRRNPKWLIGYSDISALHAMMRRAGVASIHAPMAKHLSIESEDDAAINALSQILSCKDSLTYNLDAHPYNVCGEANGELRGGNLAVLAGLIGTEFDILTPDKEEDVILFIEDISEAIYSTERMLYNLHLNGSLRRIKALIVGQFTETRADKNFESTHSMIHSLLKRLGYGDLPVSFDFPVGHVSHNMPMIEGSQCHIKITPHGVEFSQQINQNK